MKDVDAERKVHTTIVTPGTSISLGGYIEETLNLVPKGANEISRIGKKILVKKLEIRGIISLLASEAYTAHDTKNGDVLAIDVVLDKHCNGTAATLIGTGGVYSSLTPFGFEHMVEKKRYKFLYRDYFCIQQPVSTWSNVYSYYEIPPTVPPTQHIETEAKYLSGIGWRCLHIELNNLNIEMIFSDEAGLVGIEPIMSNNILMTFRSYTGLSEITELRSRIEYTDV